MKTLTKPETVRFLLDHDHYCILSHRRPDGDTVGSTVGMLLALLVLLVGLLLITYIPAITLTIPRILGYQG